MRDARGLAVVICLDGCGPEYLAAADTPNLDALARHGWRAEGCAVVPTVTNVNNVSIVTGAFPEAHGITSNYYFDRERGVEVYMESAEFLLAATVFERLSQRGIGSALLAAKDKLRTLLARGVTLSASAERPPAWLVRQLGPPPDLYTVEVNLWLLDAVSALLRVGPDLGLIYVSTTDYVMHTYAPWHAESQRHLHEIDRRIGRLVEQLGEVDMAITADHGMRAKHVGIDATRLLREAGIAAQVIPIIKDRYVVHHRNLGGAAYVYLRQPARTEEARRCLQAVPGIEAVLTRWEAARAYHLHPDRIGDLMLLADAQTVFGDFPGPCVEVQVRSHGSLYERRVPMIGYGPRLAGVRPTHTKDLMTALFPPSDNRDGR